MPFPHYLALTCMLSPFHLWLVPHSTFVWLAAPPNFCGIYCSRFNTHKPVQPVGFAYTHSCRLHCHSSPFRVPGLPDMACWLMQRTRGRTRPTKISPISPPSSPEQRAMGSKGFLLMGFHLAKSSVCYVHRASLPYLIFFNLFFPEQSCLNSDYFSN